MNIFRTTQTPYHHGSVVQIAISLIFIGYYLISCRKTDAHEIYSTESSIEDASNIQSQDPTSKEALECNAVTHRFMESEHRFMESEMLGVRLAPIEYSDDVTRHDMWDILECDDIYEYERPIHSPLIWKNMRTLYRNIVKDKSTIGDEQNDIASGFHVPVETNQSPGKGRGIFASTDIPSGSIIWSTKNTARFTNASHYRKFIFELEDGLACDVLTWAYVQPILGDNGVNLLISIDLDEGALCNDGAREELGSNMGCDEDAAKSYSGGCKENYFALDGIAAGEELLCSYYDFAIEDGWIYYGL